METKNKQAEMKEILYKKQNSHIENIYLVDTVTFAIVKKSHFDRLNEQRKLYNIKSRLNTDDLLPELLTCYYSNKVAEIRGKIANAE